MAGVLVCLSKTLFVALTGQPIFFQYQAPAKGLPSTEGGEREFGTLWALWPLGMPLPIIGHNCFEYFHGK